MDAVVSGASSSAALSAKKYDVFISFRGEDTRGGFTGHLRYNLRREHIEVYVDDGMEKGDEIWASLVQAIEDSRIFVVVFSENYASSTWCLDELVKIHECKKQIGQIVIPVFYKIDPSNVRKQTGTYREAFIKHEGDLRHSQEKLGKWKAALADAAAVVGWDSRNFRDESELIEKIVNDILKKLGYMYANESKDTVGIKESCEQIELLLAKSSIIGIWGMGGIGKTTIAEVVYLKLFSRYERCCFLKNISQQSDKQGLDYLNDELRHELLGTEGINYRSKPKVAFDMERLSQKKVLIVLDDVATFQQLTYFDRYYNHLRPDSRVIITSRDRQLLGNVRNVEIYEVKQLGSPEALKLFSLNAFHQTYPAVGFEELSKEAVVYARGIPLALKVLGSHLGSHFRSMTNTEETTEQWKCELTKLKKVPNKDIQSVLKLSYDGLDRLEKKIFLDIACFLNGEQKQLVIKLMNSYEFHGDSGIKTLLDKALITISVSNRVEMHKLIKEIGWEIIREESNGKPEESTRLWDHKEVDDVLRNNKGTHKVEGITLDVSRISDLHLSADAFKRMANLRFLKFYSSVLDVGSSKVHLPADRESISDQLRYFYWVEYPSRSLPSTFRVEKLIELHLHNSLIGKLWDGVKDIVNLRKLDLHGSKQLTELPDFSKASNLEVVLLYNCSSLCHVHPSLLRLHSLVELNLSGCLNIKSLQSEVHLRSLENLNIKGCSSLKEFSLTSDKIIELDLKKTIIETLPSSIGCLNNIKRLYIPQSLKELPNELSKLKLLEIMSISAGRELDVSNLHIIFDGLQSLKSLVMMNCTHLCQLPDNINVLSSLTTLALNGSNVECLPASIKHLSSLENLDISNCRMLRFLPELPPSIKLLEASNCTSMEKAIPPRACWMKFTNCVRLDEDSLYAILKDFHLRINQGLDIKICLPGNRLPMGFIRWIAHASLTTELRLSSRPLGFAFYFNVSLEFTPLSEGHICSIKFECCLDDIEVVRGSANWFDADYKLRKSASSDVDIPATELISDHVYLWYEAHHSEAILKEIEKSRANEQLTTDQKLSFQFSIYDSRRKKLDNAIIKECGVLPLYASEYGYSTS